MSRPPQVLAVGRNYLAHAEELGNEVPKSPLLFWKGAGSLCEGGQAALPRWSEGPTRQDYEGEIALILGRDLGPGTPALPDDPWQVVRGVAAALDLSDRDMQRREPQWVRAKGFAGSCAVGAEVPRPADPKDLSLKTYKQGALVQDGHSAQLIFPFRELLVYLHGFLRLFAGDILLTGTPAGVGPVQPGDQLRVEVARGAGDAAELLATLELRLVEGPKVPPFRRGRLAANSGNA